MTTHKTPQHLVMTQCPVCSGALHVSRLACSSCDSALEGAFSFGWLQGLSREQIQFIQAFLTCRGKIKDVEQMLGVSYPTVVARLNEVVQAIGLETAPVASAEASEAIAAQRQHILDDLAAGRLSAAEATTQIRALGEPEAR